MTVYYGWSLQITELHDETEQVPRTVAHSYGNLNWRRQLTPDEMLRIIVLAAGDALDRRPG